MSVPDPALYPSAQLADFLCHLAHDLRSPLMRLRFALELARAPGSAELALARADREITRIDQLLSEAQAYAGLTAQLDAEGPVRISVRDLLTQAAEDIQPGARGRHIRIEVAEGPGCSLEVRHRSLRLALCHALRQMLGAVPDGGRLELGWTRQDDNTVIIGIRDYSGRVDAEALTRWFLPLHRDPRQRDQISLGLGNAMLALAMQAEGGSVQAKVAGEGVEVVAVLPGAPA